MYHDVDPHKPHFSLSYLYTNMDGVLRRLRQRNHVGFQLTHHGESIGYVQLASDAAKPSAPNRATPQPSDAAPRLPPTSPNYEPNDEDDDLPAELMQASEPAAT